MTMPSDSHLSDDRLELYALGQLSEDAVAPVEEHLLLCSSCQERLQQTDEFIAAMRSAARLPQNRPNAHPRGRAWMLAGAGAVVALLITVVLLPPVRTGGETAILVELRSTRGIRVPGSSRAPAGQPLLLRADLTGLELLPSYSLQIVDSQGKIFWKTAAAPVGELLSVAVSQKPTPGHYWVRLYDPSSPGKPLREFGLLIEAN